MAKNFANGAGTSSLGRWRIEDQHLPENEVAEELRAALRQGLEGMEPDLPGRTLRKALFLLAVGGLTNCPFPEEGVFELTVNLRKILKRHGFGEGRSQVGDADQLTDVRLMQALMTAFEDPDAYFCEWWAKGVWLGSPTRPMPRAPALYDRKTKWALKDEGDSLHGDWTTNYSSLKGHEEKVKAQYDAEVKNGLMAKISLGEALVDELRDPRNVPFGDVGKALAEIADT